MADPAHRESARTLPKTGRRLDGALFILTILVLFLATGMLLYALVWPQVYGENPVGTVRLGPWWVIGLVAVLVLFAIAMVRLRQARHRAWRLQDAHSDLLDSQRRFHATFDSAFQHMALLAPDGHLIEVNQTMLDFAGLEQDDVVGRPFWRTHWWFGSDRTQHQLQTALRAAVNGQVTRFAAELRGRDGQLAHVDLSLKPIRDKDDEVVLVLFEARDMTTRLRGDDLSRQQAQIIDQIHSAVIVCDLEERVVSWNQGAQRLFGLPAQAAVGQHLSMIYPSDLNVRARLGEVYRDLWKQGWYEATLPMVDHSRQRFSGHLSLSLLRDAKRRVIGTVAIVSDLTLWEGQVRAGEELARLMAETDLETMIFEAEGLALVYANPRACQAVGRSLRELVGTRLTDYTEDYSTTLVERLSGHIDPGSGIEILAGRQICTDGSVRLVEMRVEAINCGAERFYGTRLFPVSEEIERIRREGEAAAGKIIH